MPSLPADARRSLLVYNALFPLVFLLLLPGLLRRMIRRGGFREKIGQRFGRYDQATRARFATGRWWWIHSISVGETGIALKLARELHQRAPNLSLVISVTTSTGFALAEKAACDWLTVIYNPLDAPGIVRDALDLIRPERLLLVEGEAWPNLLAGARERGVSTVLVNARLSPRSERRMLLARHWIAPIFRLLDAVCVPGAGDLARWQNLGLLASQLHLTGSVKFDTVGNPPPSRQSEFRELLARRGISPTAPILVAGSTWAPEERILAELLTPLRAEVPDLVLILVPRHVERTPQLVRELTSLGLPVLLRSHLSAASAPASIEPPIILVDATGELPEWYGLATVAFVGKSLPGIVEVGGQNPAEPIALGIPTTCGPHMENFRDLVELLRNHRVLQLVNDRESLFDTLRWLLLLDAPSRQRLATASQTALLNHQGATARTAQFLLSGSPVG